MPGRVLFIHDTLVPPCRDVATWEILKAKLSEQDISLEGAQTFLEGAHRLRKNQYDVVVADQGIPKSRGKEALPTYGGELARRAAEKSAQTGRRCLVLQYSANNNARLVSRGPDECPIFMFNTRYDIGQMVELIVSWLQGELDPQMSDFCTRGLVTWRSPSVEAKCQQFLQIVHDCRHQALSPYHAICVDIQNFSIVLDDTELNYVTGSDSLVSRIVDALKVNTDNVEQQLFLGGMLDTSIKTPEGVVAGDALDCGLRSAGLEAEQALREACHLVGDAAKAGDHANIIETGQTFTCRLERFQECCEQIVQAFQKEFGLSRP